MDSAVGLDGHRPEELFVLGGQLGRDGDALLAASEKDARIGAPAQNLLDGVARRVGGAERDLDRLQELLEERVDLTFPSHRAPYDIIGRSKVVDGWIAGVTAPVPGSTCTPTWTATVSIRISVAFLCSGCREHGIAEGGLKQALLGSIRR